MDPRQRLKPRDELKAAPLAQDEDVRYELSAGECLVVPQGVWHRFETPDGVKVLSVAKPGPRLAEDDSAEALSEARFAVGDNTTKRDQRLEGWPPHPATGQDIPMPTRHEGPVTPPTLGAANTGP